MQIGITCVHITKQISEEMGNTQPTNANNSQQELKESSSIVINSRGLGGFGHDIPLSPSSSPIPVKHSTSSPSSPISTSPPNSFTSPIQSNNNNGEGERSVSNLIPTCVTSGSWRLDLSFVFVEVLKTVF